MVEVQDIKNCLYIEDEACEPLQHASIVDYMPIANSESIETAEDANKIFLHHGCPAFLESDTPKEKLSKITQIIAAGVDLPIDAAATLLRLEEIERWQQADANCDVREIELANMHTVGCKDYDGLTLDEIKHLVDEAQQEVNMLQSLQPSDQALLRQVLSEGPSVALAESMGHLYEATRGVYLREQIYTLLGNRQDICSKALMLIMSDVNSIDDICTSLQCERVELLRVVYQLCSKGILSYNRIADNVTFAE